MGKQTATNIIPWGRGWGNRQLQTSSQQIGGGGTDSYKHHPKGGGGGGTDSYKHHPKGGGGGGTDSYKHHPKGGGGGGI